MLNSKKKLEKFLQQQRFKRVIPFLKGAVLDFGGNEGELQPYIKGAYTLVNYDYSKMEQGNCFNTIVALAVIEHIEKNAVSSIFEKFKSVLTEEGSIVLTTPTPLAKPVLEFLAFVRLLDKKNIEEHKHYWNKSELTHLADENGFSVSIYKKFQFGFNQFVIFNHKK